MRNFRWVCRCRRRKNRWVTKIISQVKQAPYTEMDIMAANEGFRRHQAQHDRHHDADARHRQRIDRNAAPADAPNTAGACPARDSENIMRVVIYSWLFIADSAATSTIKLKIPAAAGRWMTFIAIRNGLSPVPDWRQGTMASIRAIDSM